MAAILIFFIFSSLKPYVGLSCNFVEDIGTIWILRFARIMHSFFQSRLGTTHIVHIQLCCQEIFRFKNGQFLVF